ncbi:type II toxin-antitoxin system Phd/YefM family antitoxin [Candidatus Gracilibacteria bacterium]|nr:type II toxin-antitoxin system Phd/YefM family antitoxin [Candidatus Gracilibacteria bacterium]
MSHIEQRKFVSSTQLKNHTKDVLDTTDDLGEVFIMNNNKPRAVLVSVEQYNKMPQQPIRIVGDTVFISEYDEKRLKDAEQRFQNGESISDTELFDKLAA